jgi:hypothetical protein
MLANVTPQLAADFVMKDGRWRVAEDTDRKPARLYPAASDVDDDLGVIALAAERDRDYFKIR